MGVGSLKIKAVFLDRDGVINEAIIREGRPYPPQSVHEMVISADALESLQRLKSEGFALIGATNQPDVARGTTSKELVEGINHALLQQLPLDEIRVCYHDDHDYCDCRKPAAGLLLQAAVDKNIDLQNSFMIGDRWKDIQAGKKAGCRTIWLDKGYQEPFIGDAPDFITTSLMDAANWIINHYKGIENEHIIRFKN